MSLNSYKTKAHVIACMCSYTDVKHVCCLHHPKLLILPASAVFPFRVLLWLPLTFTQEAQSVANSGFPSFLWWGAGLVWGKLCILVEKTLWMGICGSGSPSWREWMYITAKNLPFLNWHLLYTMTDVADWDAAWTCAQLRLLAKEPEAQEASATTRNATEYPLAAVWSLLVRKLRRKSIAWGQRL